MTLIMMSNNKVNQLAASDFENKHLTNPEDVFLYPTVENGIQAQQEITLLDLEANGLFQQIPVEELAAFLVKNKLIKSEGYVNLIVSDVLSNPSMTFYASKLVYHLAERYQMNIRVRIVEDLNYDLVFISPPDNINDTWKIFGLDTDNKTRDYNFLIGNQDKTLIWEGENIIDWCIEEHKVIEKIEKIQDDLDLGEAYRHSRHFQ